MDLNYERIFDQLLEALLILDGEGRVHSANLRAARLLQTPRESLAQRSIAELVAPESADDLAAVIQDALATGTVAGRNLRIILPDRTEKFAELSACRLEAPEAEPLLALSLLDVTERRLLEEELKQYTVELYRRVEERTLDLEESRERFAGLFEKAATPLVWLDPSGKLQSANRAFYQLTGQGREIEGGLLLTELLVQELDQERVAQYLDLHRRGYDAPSRLELEVHTAEGGRLWTEWFIRFEPLTDQLLVSMIDITEAKTAREKLQESEARYRTLVETSPDAITLADLEGKVLMVNQRTVELYGAGRPEQMLGKNVLELIVPEDRERALESAQKTLATGKVMGVEYRAFKRDGSTFNAELSVSLITDRQGRPLALIGITRDITERKRIEEELARHREHLEEQVKARSAELLEQKNFLQSVIDSAYDLIFVIDERGKYVLMNPAARLAVNIADEEAVGLQSGRTVHPEDQERVASDFLKALNGQKVESELRIKSGESGYRDLHVKLTPLLWRGKKHVLGVGSDITEKKRIEEDLRESERRHRDLFEQALDAIYINDFEGNFIDANPAALNLLGYHREEIRSLNYASLLDPNHLSLALSHLEEIIRTGVQQGPIELKLLRKDGSWIEVETLGSLLYREGRPWAVQGVARDLSERKKAEQELSEYQLRLEELVIEKTGELAKSEQKYRALFEESLDAVYWSSREGRFIEVNPAAAQIFGYSRDDMIGMSVFEIYADPADRRRFQEEIEARGAVRDYELKLKRKDGAVRDCLVSASLVKDSESKVAGYQGIIRDVTERRREQEARSRLHEQLLLAEKMAALGQMAGGVVHEMNNPLTAVSFYAESLAKETALPKKSRDQARRIQEAAERIQRLVRGLVSYASSQEVEFEEVDLKAVVLQVVDSLAHEREKTPKARIKTRLSRSLPRIMGSPEQLFHLVSNLIVNAMNALPDGKGEISVQARKKDAEVMLTVKDNGVGIPSENLPHIFTPFFSRREKKQGSGLGLSIVQRVVERHQGKITIESKPQKGTTVRVALPALPRQS